MPRAAESEVVLTDVVAKPAVRFTAVPARVLAPVPVANPVANPAAVQPAPAINPYATPHANVATEPAEAGSGEFIQAGQKVAAGRGLAWVTEGFQLFMGKPLTWMGMGLVAMMVSGGLGKIPVIGTFINVVYAVMLNAGMMIAARNWDQTQEMRFGNLYEGYKRAPGALAIAGLLSLGMMLLVLGLAGALGGMAFVGLSTGEISAAGVLPAVGALFVGVVGGFIYVAMMVFTPALIALEGLRAIAALRASLSGFRRNLLPLTVCGLVATVALGIPIGALAMVAMASPIAMLLDVSLLMLGILPLIACTTYAAYRNIYYSE